VKRLSWPAWLIAAGVILLFVAAALYVAPSDQYIYLPDEARALAPRVQVEGERRDDDGGGIHYVAVDVRKASILEKMLPSLHEGASFEDVENVLAEGEDERAHRRTELAVMRRSQEYATAVALRSLGYRVPTKRLGVQVEATVIGYPAAAKLRRGDWIRAVDGKPVRRMSDVTSLLRRRKPGDVVRLRIERGTKVEAISLRAVEWSQLPGRAFVGMTIDDVFDVLSIPVEVQIDLGQVGGPSAGLAFALDVLEELGRNVDRGQRVAATGEIRIDGRVLPVGGVKQKAIAARRSGMDVFLVPVQNAEEARRYGKSLRIVPVESFQQALRALATLRPQT
jgi:PDZ domain-containing protein